MISLDDAPQGYQDFDKGAAKKFVIDPHGLLAGKAAELAPRFGRVPVRVHNERKRWP